LEDIGDWESDSAMTQDAADILLINDNFASIVAGTEEGRIIIDQFQFEHEILERRIPRMTRHWEDQAEDCYKVSHVPSKVVKRRFLACGNMPKTGDLDIKDPTEGMAR
jgi:hypothetical protein